MEEYLAKLLKETNIPAYYVTKKNSKNLPCIVYDFIESTNATSDDEEELLEYEVFFNIYAGNEIINIKRKLMKILKKAGFNKKIIPQPMYMDDLGYFEQALQYSKIMEYKNI